MELAANTPSLSPSDWKFVQDLISDVQAEEDREQLANLYGQWTLSLRAFRRVEARRMVAAEPTETDILFHRACVSELLSLGTLILIGLKEHSDEELARYGIRRDVVDAMVADLRNTFDEWHAQVPQGCIDELTSRIFDAAPELNLKDPRA